MRSDKQLCLKQTWIWDENAVALSSNKIKGSYPFRLFYNWQEFDNFFALFISAEKFYVLPKHAFDYEEPENGMSEQQLEDLRRIFTREITHK
ncbi:YcxB family protein [Bartonella tamiae]|nr:YcxB family protein [Bartonella tamiae]